MCSIQILGAVLIVAGILALVIPYISITQTRRVVDLGSLRIDAQEHRVIPLPAIAGVIAVITGLSCVYLARRPGMTIAESAWARLEFHEHGSTGSRRPKV